MFYTQLLVTLLISLGMAWLTVSLFSKPAAAILRRVTDATIADSWLRYLQFAIFVVAVSTGVRIDELES